MVDIAGSKVTYEKLGDLYAALEKFSQKYEIVKFKDRIQNPVSSGYRDILMNVRMKNGHIVEFRLHLEEIDKVAAIEHDSYKVIRSIEAKAKMEGRKLSVSEVNQINKLRSQNKALYDQAWEKIVKNDR